MNALIIGDMLSRTVNAAFAEAGVGKRERLLRERLWAELGPVLYAVHRRAFRDGSTRPDAPAFLELRAVVEDFLRENRPPTAPALALAEAARREGEARRAARARAEHERGR